MNDTIKRIIELESLIKYHDYLYHVLDKPTLSDSGYDTLVTEYNELVKETPDYAANFVPGFVTENGVLTKVDIIEPMISIDKTNTTEAFQRWIKKNIEGDTVYEEKLDGMALRIIYIDGEIHQIHTRGKNEQGGDVSHRRFLLKNIPDTIKVDGVQGSRIEVTGEAFCKFKDFEAYCEKYKIAEGEKDTRSAVSGLMKRHYKGEMEDLPIYFKAYQASANVRASVEDYRGLRNWLTDHSFDVPLELTGSILAEFLSLTTKPINEYPIDGIVAKDNNLASWDKEQGNQYYNYAICYKFPTKVLKSTVKGIEWSLSTIGELIGVVLYEPVEYDGTMLSRARLDYAQSYFDKGLAVGSVIEVTKANEIIPKMLSLVEAGKGQRLFYPSKCPFCHHPISKDDGIPKCINESCDGQVTKKFVRLTDVDGFYIKGLGDKRLFTLVEKGYLSKHADLFDLAIGDLTACGIDENTSGKIISQIAEVNKLPLSKWLFSLAIPGLGAVRAIEISNLSAKVATGDQLKFHDIKDLLFILSNPDAMRDMFGLDGIVISDHVRKNNDDIHAFLSHYDFITHTLEAPSGVPIAITGSWVGMKREELIAALRGSGYMLSDTVTKSSRAVLVGSKPSPSKIAKAQKWEIEQVHIHECQNFEQVLNRLLSLN